MAGRPEAKQERVLAAFFEAAASPGQWQAALSLFAECFASDTATLLIWDRARGMPSVLELIGPLAAGKRLYGEHYGRIDPHRDLLAEQPEDRWLSTAQFFDDAYIRRSEYFNDFLIPHGIRYGACVRFGSIAPEESPMLGLARAPRASVFSPAAMAALERLTPRLNRAILLHQKIERIRTEHQASIGLLEQSSHGMIVADASGRVALMNAQAELMIATADGLSLERGVLVPARSFERNSLARALAHSPETGGVVGGAFLIGRPSGRRPYAVLVTPVPGELRHHVEGGRDLAMIVVTDFDKRAEIRAEMLMQQFGLTGAEGQLAVALAQGKNLRQLVAETGKAIPTLRTQLAAIFEKMHVKRQADLVRLVLSLPAIRT